MSFNPTADTFAELMQNDGYNTLRLSRDTVVVQGVDSPEQLNHVQASADEHDAATSVYEAESEQVRASF